MAEIALARRSPKAHRRRSRHGTVFWRLLLLLAAAVVVMVIVETVVQIVLNERFAITEITVHSDLAMPRDELLATAGLRRGASYFELDAGRIEERIAALPQVKTAAVEKNFPNRVTLTVEARRPLAVAFVNVDGRTTPLVMDSEGVVFARSGALADWDLPVISGLRFEDPSVGIRLPERLHPLLESLGKLRDSAPGLLSQFSEFRVSGGGGRGVEVVAYPASYRTPVRLGDHVAEDLLKYAIMVLDLMNDDDSVGAGVAELDFRTGQAVMRPAEE